MTESRVELGGGQEVLENTCKRFTAQQKLTIRGDGSSIKCFQIVWLAEHAVLVQRELLAGGQLSAARVAREARQVVDLLARLAHPIRRGDAAAALGALCAEVPGETASVRHHHRHQQYTTHC